MFKDKLKLISHADGQRFRTRFFLTLIFLCGLLAYSLANSFIRLPLGIPAAVLAILFGLFQMGVVFWGFFQKTTDNRFKMIPAKSFRILFISWVVSIAAIISGYSGLYTEVFRRGADSFAGVLGGVSSVYFSVVTFATVGYGDIYPTSVASKLLVISEILIPVCLLPILLAASISWVINRNYLVQTGSDEGVKKPLSRIK